MYNLVRDWMGFRMFTTKTWPEEVFIILSGLKIVFHTLIFAIYPWMCPFLPFVGDFQSVVTFEISLCVIALSLSCEAAALASGLFIVIANLTVTANGESWFWFGVFRRFVWTKAAWRPDEVIKASHAKCFYRTGQSASKGLVSRNLWVVFKRRLRAKSTRRTTNTISSAHSHTSFQYKHTMKTPQERESKQDRQRERDPVRFP